MSPDPRRPGDDYGLGYAAGARQALDHLGDVLRPGETVRCAATAFLEGHSGLLAATTERLLFVHRDETPINSSYPDIARFRAKAGVLTADLEVEDHNGRAVLRQIHPRSRLYDLVGILQDRPGTEVQAPAPSPPPSPDAIPGAPASPPGPIGGRPAGRTPAGPREPVALPPGGWLGPGEWLVSTFPGVTADLEAGRKLTGNAAVTNRRLLLLDPSGSVAADWALGRVQSEGAASPRRVRLSPAVEFEFLSAESAKEFSRALITAGFLAGPRLGSDG
ncbi:MAG TPA: PH domain-containing protein [Acidimicrobiales bacterium]|nr:PH domain-containing protein [Acidimicrobiales bacterium]